MAASRWIDREKFQKYISILLRMLIVYSPHMIERARFGCPSCGAVWTPPLRRLPAWLENEVRWDVCSDSPVGTWSLRPDARGRPEHPIALNITDVQGLVQHEEITRSSGCCGIGYREKLPNLRCANCRHEAAFRLSDGDHCNHAIFVPATPLETVLSDEPDDDALQTVFFARRTAVIAPLSDAGMDAIPKHLRVIADILWNDDLQDSSLFPELTDFSVLSSGLEIRLSLDGVVVRPPWPDGERDRLIALGAIPRGLPNEPLEWWFNANTGAAKTDRHQWWQWCVDGELCVAWQRAPNGKFSEKEAVAFRLPWELWELTFREALRGTIGALCQR